MSFDNALIHQHFLTNSNLIAGVLFFLALMPASISGWSNESGGIGHHSLEFGWIAGPLVCRSVEGHGPVDEVVWQAPRWSFRPASGASVALLSGVLVLLLARRLGKSGCSVRVAQ